MFCLSWKEKDSEPRSADTTEYSLTEVEVATGETRKVLGKRTKQTLNNSDFYGCCGYQMGNTGRSPWKDPWWLQLQGAGTERCHWVRCQQWGGCGRQGRGLSGWLTGAGCRGRRSPLHDEWTQHLVGNQSNNQWITSSIYRIISRLLQTHQRSCTYHKKWNVCSCYICIRHTHAHTHTYIHPHTYIYTQTAASY